MTINLPVNHNLQLAPSAQSAHWSAELITQLQMEASSLGFSSLGVSTLDVGNASAGLKAWLAQGFHGSMDYMARHEALRGDPALLVRGAVTAVMVTMPYTPNNDARTELKNTVQTGTNNWLTKSWQSITEPESAYVARYALGRDYHKVVRAALAKLATRLEKSVGEFGYRVFCDSAPVMEVELARKAGLGWRGKHTLLLSREQGSMFFIGTIYTTLPMAKTHADQPTPDGQHCGSCQRCIEVCPTQAIVAPYRLDARKCISYLTIENKGAIALEYRRAIGNRIYGCDDCQLACPWNKYAVLATSPDFAVRNQLDDARLISLLGWTQAEFETRMAGSAIYRIGYWRWMRNLAVGMGNAVHRLREHGQASASDLQALITALGEKSLLCDPLIAEQAMVLEHINWALAQ